MSKTEQFEALPLAELSSASRRSIQQQLANYDLSATLEAVGLLRKVQVAYGKGSWPNIDEFLARLDNPAVAGGASK